MKKNIVIAILGIVIVGQSVFFWVSKSSAQNPVTPEVITDGAASALAIAAETQNQICCDIPVQMAWLRKHLEKIIIMMEKKYHLEPLPTRIPVYQEDTRPFVTPYEPPDCHSLGLDTDVLKTSVGLHELAAKMDLRSTSIGMINNSMEYRIDNFYQRLKRLESMLEQEN